MKREPKQHLSEVDQHHTDLPEEALSPSLTSPEDPELPVMDIIDMDPNTSEDTAAADASLQEHPENVRLAAGESTDADTDAAADADTNTDAAPAASGETSESRASSVPSRERRERRAAARARKKQRADRSISAAMCFLFFVCMLVITIFLLAVPRSTSSQVERRSLAQWPSFSGAGYFSGAYTSAVTEYYDDTVPARDSFKNIGNNIKSLFGITSAGSVEVIGSIHKAEDSSATTAAEEILVEETLPAKNEETTASAEGEEDETSQSKDYHIENLDVIDENGYLVVLQDGHWRAFALYVGVDVSLYADTINYIRQMVDPSINIYVLPAPLAAQFYIPSNYLEYHEDMENTFRDLSSRLVSGITAVDSIDVLNSHNSENIYLRTDHHWAHLGAHYAAGELAKAAGVPYADLDTYQKNTREGYVGTMYGLTGSANLLNDPETFEYFIPTNSYIVDYYDQSMNFLLRKGLFFDTVLSESYGVALGEDDLIIHVKTDVGNGRKLLVVKDSYGNATIPFLAGSFEEIYIIDQRFFDFNLIDFINKIKVTDIAFIHDYYSLTGPEAELLEYITYSNLDTTIPDFVPEAEVPAEGNPDIDGTPVLYAVDVLGYEPEAPEEEETAAEETEGEYGDPAVDDIGYETEEVYYEEPVNYDEPADTYYEETEPPAEESQDNGEEWL